MKKLFYLGFFILGCSFFLTNASTVGTKLLTIRRGVGIKTPTLNASGCVALKVKIMVNNQIYVSNRTDTYDNYNNISSQPISIYVKPGDSVTITARAFRNITTTMSGPICNTYNISKTFTMPNMNVNFKVDKSPYGVSIIEE